jgi:anti-sigma-K factor RskA
MRYDDPRLLDALAREYVLGTLRGPARTRFARVLGASLGARRAVLTWERNLAPLARTVKPVAPPAEAWSRIETTLGIRATKPQRSAGLWPALAAALALAAVLLGALYVGQHSVVTEADYIAVFTDEALGPVWLVQGFEQARELRVSTPNPRAKPATNSYELWMLPGGGANPVSLGLLPDMGSAQLALSAVQLTVLGNTPTLAVSLEPAGGSPTGLPTGPVLYTAPLVRS